MASLYLVMVIVMVGLNYKLKRRPKPGSRVQNEDIREEELDWEPSNTSVKGPNIEIGTLADT